MDGETISLVLYFGVTAFVASLVVLYWPYRRHRSYTLRCVIAVPRDQVWRRIHIDLEDPDNAQFHGELESAETDPDDPSITTVGNSAAGFSSKNMPKARC